MTTYVARTDGGESVLELRRGTLDDIPAVDRDNWRAVLMTGDTAVDPAVEESHPTALTVVEPYVEMQITKVGLPVMLGRLFLKEYAASLRWKRTQGGLTLPNGVAIDTSDGSKAKIDQALSVLERGWASALNWKTKDGWIAVDLATMTAIAQAVVAFEQNCFDAEQAISAAIDAGSITATAQIDAYPWP